MSDIFTCLQYLIVISKYCGVSTYAIIKNNSNYIVNVNRTDKFIFILMFVLLTSLNINAYIARFYSENNQLDYNINVRDNLFELTLTYINELLATLANLTFGLIKRKEYVQLLMNHNKIITCLKNEGITISYDIIHKFSIKIYLLLNLVCSIFIICDWFLYFGAYFNLIHYLITSIAPLVVEVQIITNLYIILYIIKSINEKFKQFNNLKIIVNYHLEVYNNCLLLNNCFNHIIFRLFVAEVSAVSVLFWLVVLIQDGNFKFIESFSMFSWVTSNFLGIIIIVFYCEAVTKEVSL